MNRLPITFPTAPEGVPSLPEWEWKVVVKDYEDRPDSVARCWRYLSWHPAFWSPEPIGQDGTLVVTPVGWLRGVQFDISESDEGQETTWMEVTPILWDNDLSDEEVKEVSSTHAELRTGFGVSGASFTICMITLARMVHNKWGNDREFLTPALEDKWSG